MADAAAFFANKKKKKKGFKGFNANKIDAATVTSTVHVDAPLMSTDADVQEGGELMNGAAGTAAEATKDAQADQWDDEALAAQTVKRTVVVPVTVKPAAGSAAGGTTQQKTRDLLDMKSLDLKGNEEEQIAEKLRIEENKNKLAAAREGMEREAQRIKEEKEKKEQEAADKASNRFGAAAASVGGPGGSKWVPSRLRDGGASRWGSAASGGFGGGSQKVDTEDQELFPDLAAADAMLEKQKQDQVAYQPPKKTPVGGGASWASSAAKPTSRPKLNLKPKAKTAEEESTTATTDNAPAALEPASEPSEAAPAPAANSPAPAPAADTAPAASTTAASTAAPAPIKPIKKKKKKDLSTFGKK
mmetsp:Transcript_62887/g.153116  ORF Transcript_62887/g.153116 Transcript_62887/m.153116 type:complete len:359 (+) Transcript_62887:151-1227(+)